MAGILVFSEKDNLAFELVSKGKEFGAALNMGLAAALLGEEAAARALELLTELSAAIRKRYL